MSSSRVQSSFTGLPTALATVTAWISSSLPPAGRNRRRGSSCGRTPSPASRRPPWPRAGAPIPGSACPSQTSTVSGVTGPCVEAAPSAHGRGGGPRRAPRSACRRRVREARAPWASPSLARGLQRPVERGAIVLPELGAVVPAPAPRSHCTVRAAAASLARQKCPRPRRRRRAPARRHGRRGA